VVDDSNYDLGICPDLITLSQINDQAAADNCVLPEHSTPACVEGQQKCGFTCTDGFTASLDSNPPACVCAPPSVVCNGQCTANGPCPSAQAQASKKRRWIPSGSCLEKGPGWAVCGVYGGSARAWECVNTARDLESCTYLTFHTPRVCFRNADCILFFACSPVLQKKVVAAPFRSRPTLLSARTALRLLALQTSHVCMANASSTAVSQDTSPRATAVAASASTLNSMMRRMYPRMPTDSNTSPSGGTERSSKISAFPALSANPFYNY
jgi:hypothetical protein